MTQRGSLATVNEQVDTIDLSVIIPSFNEAASLKELANEILASVDRLSLSYEIIFIDDGSDDNTPDILDSLKCQHENKIKIITLRRNFGKSAALAAGFKYCRGQIVITLDGDLQDDPKEIPRFIDEINKGADLVTGWKAYRKDPFEKRIPSHLFNKVTSWVSGLSIHDFNCGFKAYRRNVVKSFSLYGERHRYIPFLVHRAGFNVEEITVHHRKRRYGKSKFGLERYFRGFFDLLTIFLLTRYMVRPMHLLGGIGSVITLTGFGLFLYLFFGRWIHGISIGTSPLFSVGLFLMAIGLQIVITGFLAELIVYSKREPPALHSIKHIS